MCNNCYGDVSCKETLTFLKGVSNVRFLTVRVKLLKFNYKSLIMSRLDFAFLDRMVGEGTTAYNCCSMNDRMI